jgi:hypothetical protein
MDLLTLKKFIAEGSPTAELLLFDNKKPGIA